MRLRTRRDAISALKEVALEINQGDDPHSPDLAAVVDALDILFGDNHAEAYRFFTRLELEAPSKFKTLHHRRT